MGIINKMTKAFSKAGVKAKKTYDTARVELKIRGYSQENQELYIELGRLLYESRKQNIEPDTERLDEIIHSIDVVTSRIKHMEKLLAGLKRVQPTAPPEPGKTISDKQESKKYVSLSKKDDDLIITRTDKGITVLRFCSQCDMGNLPNSSVCTGCGHEFGKCNQVGG